MFDIFTKKKRSDVMSRILDSGNKDTELRLIQVFRRNGITGWRRGCSLPLIQQRAKRQVASVKAARPNNQEPLNTNRRRPHVRPDFVFPRLRVAVFVDGCFWHGCPKHVTWPKTRAAFWRQKIEGNRARDRQVNCHLRVRGWTVIRIWEHELQTRNQPRLLKRLACLSKL